MISSLPYYIQSNIVYNIERNKDGYSYGYSSSCKFSFNISCGFGVNYSYSPF